VGGEESVEYLGKPLETISRRYSDSSVITPPSISITPAREIKKWRRSSNAGIVCLTGELLNLKCLTSSAQEIRSVGTDNIDDDGLPFFI